MSVIIIKKAIVHDRPSQRIPQTLCSIEILRQCVRQMLFPPCKPKHTAMDYNLHTGVET